jgi:hypothetical protein
MLCQSDARLFLIHPRGRLKKGLKASGLRLVGYIMRREEIECSGGEFVNSEMCVGVMPVVEGQLHRVVTRCVTYVCTQIA